jgi:hypothetical protein
MVGCLAGVASSSFACTVLEFGAENLLNQGQNTPEITFQEIEAFAVGLFPTRPIFTGTEPRVETGLNTPIDLTGETSQMRVNKASWAQTDRRKNFISPREWGARVLEIRSVALGSVDYRQIESQPLHPWAIMRRLLTEARDRCHLRGE